MAQPEVREEILVTGANGHLGRLFLSFLDAQSSCVGGVRAVVRSRSAAEQVTALSLERLAPRIEIVDYRDAAALAAVAEGCRSIVHFVGILKESSRARYNAAHEQTCEALALAAARAGIDSIVYLSILGASPTSANACLTSKGCAEQILAAGDVPATILRVPMVIGPDDHASRALRAQACAKLTPLVAGGTTWQQPIAAHDVIRAIDAALSSPAPESRFLDLAGPEALTHRALVERVAGLHGRVPRIVPIPLFAVRAFAAIAERVSSAPPITRAMLEVLQRDDRVDPSPAYAALDLTPISLDEALERYVGPEAISL